MRVLIVLTSNDRRGAEIEGSCLAVELRAMGVHAETAALAPGAGSSLLDVPVLGRKPLGLSTLRTLRARARQYDVVIAYGSTSLPACAMALVGSRVPFVYRSIGDPSAWVRGRFHRWRTGILMRRAAHVVALWPDAADSIQKLYSIDTRRISVIPNARSSDDFRPPTDAERVEARASLGLPVDAQIVGCVGSITAEKRLHLAIGAVAELPGVHLLVVGDGPGRTELEQEANAVLGGRVTFTGVLDDVVPAYRAIDVLLLTSSTEGMPGVVLEASMSGVPVVAADVGAVRSLFEAGVEGEVLAPETCPGGVSFAVDRVLSNRRGAAPARMDAFGWQAVACKWNEFVHRYASNPGTVKVLAVIDSTGGGGAELSMAAMAPMLAQHGVEIEVAYFHHRTGALEKFEAAGVRLIHVSPGRSRVTTIWRLRRVVRERRPDVVHTMVFEADIIGRTAAFLTRTPVMSSIISEMYGPSQFGHAARPWKLRLAQLADIGTARFVSRFHAVSRTAADSVGPRLLVNRSKIEVIYRGRSVRELGLRTPERRAAVRRELQIPNDVALVLAVGRLVPPKGFDVAVRAIKKVLVELPVTLVIAGGTGSSGPELEALVEAQGLGEHVRFLGHRLDVPDLIAAADALVAPSRWEGLPGAALEASLIGTPLVCSDLPVFRELVGIAGVEASSTFVPVDDPDAFAAALVEVLLERGTRNSRTVQPAEEFTIEKAASAHSVLYRSIARQRRGGLDVTASDACTH